MAAFLAGFATLPQSRAALLGLILTAPIALLASSDRIRLLARMAVVGGTLAVCLPRTISVDNAVSANGNVSPVLAHAATGMWLCGLAAIVVGLALGLLEDRWAGPLARRRAGAVAAGRRRRLNPRVVRRGAVGAALVVVVAAAAVAAPAVVHVVHTVVRNGKTDASTGSTRLLSTSPEERFDYARVALHLFSGAPVLGIGSGNFGRRYDAQRRFVKHSQYTHNLPLRVLSETGLVGVLIFGVLVAALIAGLVMATRRRNDLARAGAVIALCVSGYFLVHSCLDWVDEFPALAAPAIAIPLAAIAAAARPGQDGAPRWRPARDARRRIPDGTARGHRGGRAGGNRGALCAGHLLRVAAPRRPGLRDVPLEPPAGLQQSVHGAVDRPAERQPDHQRGHDRALPRRHRPSDPGVRASAAPPGRLVPAARAGPDRRAGGAVRRGADPDGRRCTA